MTSRSPTLERQSRRTRRPTTAGLGRTQRQLTDYLRKVLKALLAGGAPELGRKSVDEMFWTCSQVWKCRRKDGRRGVAHMAQKVERVGIRREGLYEFVLLFRSRLCTYVPR